MKTVYTRFSSMASYGDGTRSGMFASLSALNSLSTILRRCRIVLGWGQWQDPGYPQVAVKIYSGVLLHLFLNLDQVFTRMYTFFSIYTKHTLTKYWFWSESQEKYTIQYILTLLVNNARWRILNIEKRDHAWIPHNCSPRNILTCIIFLGY